MLMAILFGQILVSPDGGAGVYTRQLNCGANMSCTQSGTTMTLASSGGGGGGAPTTATYVTQTPDGTLSAEQALSLSGTGIMLNTTGTGVVSIYAGSTCGANQYATQTSASGVLTCSQVPATALSGTVPQSSGGTGSGALTCGANDRLTSNGAVYSCSALPVTTAYSTIQDEGGALTQRSTVNFTGAGVTCVDSGGITVCTIAGGGGGGTSPYILAFGGF